MRQIYNNRRISILEQGSIINHCFARNYVDKETFGIIITPRCDITNSKVSTIHYLPIINIHDWIDNDFWNIFSTRAIGELKGKLKNILDKYNLSFSIIEMFQKEELFSVLEDKINKSNDFNDFKKHLNNIHTLKLSRNKITSQDRISLIEAMPKISISIFKELRENRFKEFYLLERWDNCKEYVVVLLREIGSIDWIIANQISKGIWYNQLNNEQRKVNSFSNLNEDSFLQTLATLKSPFIEHLIQHFFLNFGRIGIEDHTNLENEFHKIIFTNKK